MRDGAYTEGVKAAREGRERINPFLETGGWWDVSAWFEGYDRQVTKMRSAQRWVR